MPHRKKKKFIDKKNAQTFRLVHRSQKDPLQASDDVGQRVLLPVEDKEAEKRKNTQREFGVFFEDDYDYLQHLKDVDETVEFEPVESVRVPKSSQGVKQSDATARDPILKLPSTVFASQVETEVGLLNKAAPVSGPRLDWDPDIVAGLDEDFDFDDPENVLDDDFVLKANDAVGEGGHGEGEGEWADDEDAASDAADFSDEAMDQLGDGDMFENEETKSRFTQYSMTSSVIRRTEGLTLLDDRFEKLFEEYDESEIGALDHEDIDGRVEPSSQILDSVLDEFEKEQAKVKLSDVVGNNVTADSESDDDTELVKMVIEEPGEKWDCESILSTYSNLYNHPKLISEPRSQNNKNIKLTSKLGIPLDGLQQPGLTQKQIEKEMHASQKADRASTYRPRGETPDEKKARKMAIKDERKERREEKKANKVAFGKEKIRQDKEQHNLRQNLQGVKML
ncbi:protein LTV1 homolog [Haliotis cracherodii]|uniref:protein LTV1 homolog n=1 Tax=Haliotis cracherodii TaxID=6455 RepID=UPI0039EB246F